MTKPIRPDEIAHAKETTIPEQVFEAFNELIAEKFVNGYANVRQNDVMIRILEKMPNTTRREVFDRGWLNVEEAYEAQGWRVAYDKPGYNETYEAYFTFRSK